MTATAGRRTWVFVERGAFDYLDRDGVTVLATVRRVLRAQWTAKVGELVVANDCADVDVAQEAVEDHLAGRTP